MIPIGRGQRELILGDRNTGKTTIAVDTFINHAGIDERAEHKLYCIYVAIGIRRISLKRVLDVLKATNSYDHTTIVAATASDPVSMQYMAAYVGCAIGEFYRDNQNHALVVYDDLSKHAVAYRQISLLLRRSPGRDAYPGDIFYIHSRLLERAAKLSDDFGGGSLSAFPVIETQAEDLSAFIATNVISITDGQIFLEARMFRLGQRPAINIGLSVSRIGSHAQTKIMKEIAGPLKLELAQYRTFEVFKSLGSEIDPYIVSIILRGERLIEILNQDENDPLCLEHQLLLIYAVRNRYLNALDLEQVDVFKDAISILFNLQREGLKAPQPSIPAVFQKIFNMDKKNRDYALDEFLTELVAYILEEFPATENKSKN